MSNRLFGAYRNNGGLLSSFNPVVKFLIPLSFVLITGFAGTALQLGVMFICWLVLGRLLKLGMGDMLAVLKMFRVILIFTFVIQLFLTTSGSFVAPTAESLTNAFFFTVRMTLIIGFSSIFAMITPPIDIVRLFNVIFKPLKVLRINPAELSLSMLIAIRFIPLLFTEGAKIIDAQRLKGVLPLKGEKGARRKIVTSSISLIIPLLVRTFHYASQIAITLRYRKNDDDFLRLSRMQGKDFAVVVACVIATVFCGYYSFGVI